MNTKAGTKASLSLADTAVGSDSGEQSLLTEMSTRGLSALLLASDDIRAVVTRWSGSHDIGDLSFERATGAFSQNITSESLDELALSRGESLAYFRIDLVNSGARLATLDHWFVPERVPEDLSHILATAQAPLRSCLRSLPFSNRCFYVRFHDHREPEDCSILFEHYLVTYELITRRPVAISQDRYFRSLLAGRDRRWLHAS